MDDVIGVLFAVAATVGSARVVAVAPRLGRAVGIDIDANAPRALIRPHFYPLLRPPVGHLEPVYFTRFA
jgi:hypothetical protein